MGRVCRPLSISSMCELDLNLEIAILYLGYFYKIQIRFQLIFGFKYPVCSETWEFINVINFIFPFGYKCTFKRIYAFQFELVLCKLVVKGHVVFWGQLTHTGDPGSEAHISQIPQVYENFLYQRIVIHSMQTLVITQSLFMTYNTRREHTAFTQCYEIACISFNSQYRACVPQEYFVHWLRCTDVHTPDITSIYQHRFNKWLEKIYHDFDWQSSNVHQSFKHGKCCLSRFIAQILITDGALTLATVRDDTYSTYYDT